MDPDSPFAGHQTSEPVKPGKVFVLFCTACFHVWKAPAESKLCINCKGNGEPVVTLIDYEPKIPIL